MSDADSLVADLQSPRYERRAKAFHTLSELIRDGKDEALLAELSTKLSPLAVHKDGGVRAGAISLVGAIDGEKALPLLLAHLADPEPEVRAAVEDVAEDLGEEGQPILRKLVMDAEFGVRFWAAVALTELGDAGGFDVLVDGLLVSATRFEALQGLRRLGDRRADGPVRKVLAKWFLAAIDRVAANGVLASFGDAPARDLLLKEIQNKKSDVRGLAMEVAGELNLGEAVPVLESVFHDKADAYRGSAAMGLCSMKQEKALAEVIAVLRDESEPANVRGDAAWALHLFGTDEARKALEAAKVESPEVREAVAEALCATGK